MNHSEINKEFDLLNAINLPLNYGFTYPALSIPSLLNFIPNAMLQNIEIENRASAFTRVKKECLQRSFIVVRDIPSKENYSPKIVKKSSSESVTQLPKSEHEDSDSTHHSTPAIPSQKKLNKDEKRHFCISSIMKLIESRKNDTLNELEKFGDEDVVLKASPKIRARNSKLSHFRGVSNNGRKWQVMIMGFAKKIYFGGIDTEEEASKKYDKYALLMHGLEAKTNYDYTKRELCEVLNSQIDTE